MRLEGRVTLSWLGTIQLLPWPLCRRHEAKRAAPDELELREAETRHHVHQLRLGVQPVERVALNLAIDEVPVEIVASLGW